MGVMGSYGYQIVQALITDLDPDQRVKNAMNEINSSKRLKFAVAERAEGDKILQVKSAEAGAESLYLSGVGVSRQRKAIVDGLKNSIVEFSGETSANTKDVMDLLLLPQYLCPGHPQRWRLDAHVPPAGRCGHGEGLVTRSTKQPSGGSLRTNSIIASSPLWCVCVCFVFLSVHCRFANTARNLHVAVSKTENGIDVMGTITAPAKHFRELPSIEYCIYFRTEL